MAPGVSFPAGAPPVSPLIAARPERKPSASRFHTSFQRSLKSTFNVKSPNF